MPLYSELWDKVFTKEFLYDTSLITSIKSYSEQVISSKWDKNVPIYKELDRYIAMIELDVLCAKGIGMTIEQLIDLYKINYPNMSDNENNTWYDQEGKIVFTTNKSLVNYGVSREIWEDNKENDFEAMDQLGVFRKYKSPFFKTDRVSLYKEAWEEATKKYDK